MLSWCCWLLDEWSGAVMGGTNPPGPWNQRLLFRSRSGPSVRVRITSESCAFRKCQTAIWDRSLFPDSNRELPCSSSNSEDSSDVWGLWSSSSSSDSNCFLYPSTFPFNFAVIHRIFSMSHFYLQNEFLFVLVRQDPLKMENINTPDGSCRRRVAGWTLSSVCAHQQQLSQHNYCLGWESSRPQWLMCSPCCCCSCMLTQKT